MSYSCTLDHVQIHMLGLVVSIMANYSLSVTDIVNYPQINEYNQEQVELTNTDNNVDEPIVFDNGADYVHHSWASDDGSDVDDQIVNTELDSLYHDQITDDKKKYVTHRRAFRDALLEGIKICSNYTQCNNNECTRFHVHPDNLCPHAGRNNYCDQPNCDKIVIKACRKGRKCTDTSCSFRH